MLLCLILMLYRVVRVQYKQSFGEKKDRYREETDKYIVVSYRQ